MNNPQMNADKTLFSRKERKRREKVKKQLFFNN